MMPSLRVKNSPRGALLGRCVSGQRLALPPGSCWPPPSDLACAARSGEGGSGAHEGVGQAPLFWRR